MSVEMALLRRKQTIIVESSWNNKEILSPFVTEYAE